MYKKYRQTYLIKEDRSIFLEKRKQKTEQFMGFKSQIRVLSRVNFEF